MQFQFSDNSFGGMLPEGQPSNASKEVQVGTQCDESLMKKVVRIYVEAVNSRLFTWQLREDPVKQEDLEKYTSYLLYSRLQFVNGEGVKLVDRRDSIAVPDLIFACLERIGQVVDDKSWVRYHTVSTDNVLINRDNVEGERRWINSFSDKLANVFTKAELPYQKGLPLEREGDIALYHAVVVPVKVTIDGKEVPRGLEVWSDGRSSGAAAFLAAIAGMRSTIPAESLTVLHGDWPYLENQVWRFINERNNNRNSNAPRGAKRAGQ